MLQRVMYVHALGAVDLEDTAGVAVEDDADETDDHDHQEELGLDPRVPAERCAPNQTHAGTCAVSGSGSNCNVLKPGVLGQCI